MKKIALGLVAAACSLASLTAQSDPQPTCKMCPASYISHDELQAYLKRGIANNIVDQQVRAVSEDDTERDHNSTDRGCVKERRRNGMTLLPVIPVTAELHESRGPPSEQ